MLPTYRAILRNGQLEWGEDGAPPVGPNQALVLHVIILNPENLEPKNGEALAQALEAFAEAGGPTMAMAPGAWQREVRVDRALPGRNE